MESFYSHLTKQALMKSNELEVEDRKPNILKQRVDLPFLVSNLENERACVCQWTHAHCPCRLASGMAFSPSDSCYCSQAQSPSQGQQRRIICH